MAVQGPQDGESNNTTVSLFLPVSILFFFSGYYIPYQLVLLQIFVGGLDSDVSDEDLKQPFSKFGEIVSVKIPIGKGCGFVQFANRYSSYFSVELSVVIYAASIADLYISQVIRGYKKARSLVKLA